MLVSNKRWDDAFALHSGGMQESNFSVQLIEREIEFENIDPFFAENAEKPVLGRSAVTPFRAVALTLSNVQRLSRGLLLHVRKEARCRELADERLFGRLCHDARPVAKKVELHTMRWNSGGLPVAFG